MAQLMSDFGNGSAGRTQRPNHVNKKPYRNPFLAQQKPSSYEKKYVTPYKKTATPSQKKKQATSSGARYYGKGKYPGSNIKHSVSKPKAKPKAKTSYSAKRKSGGGAWSSDGKRYYKNGYVDSRGNRVVNGKWVAGGGKKKSSGGSVKASKPKAVSKPKAAIAKSPSTVAKAVAKPKLSLLASNYEDQIYKNQLAELDDSSAAFSDDTKAKQDRLTRNHNMNQDSVQLNRTNSLQNSAEDYAARGMMRSGAYLNNMQESNKLFDDQKARMSSNYSDDSAEYARAKADYLRGIGTQKSEAKRQLADRIAVENAKRTAAATS